MARARFNNASWRSRLLLAVALMFSLSVLVPGWVPPVRAEPLIAMHDLNPDGSPYSIARAINESGQVVGVAYMDGDRATLWTDTGSDGRLQVVALPMLENGLLSEAWGINDLGQIVGATTVDANGSSRATLWTDPDHDGTLLAQALPMLGDGISSVAYGINALGQAIGVTSFENGTSRATLWEDTDSDGTLEARALPLTGDGASSVASGINGQGQVVGSIGSAAILWTDSDRDGDLDAVALPALDDGATSSATSVNNLGQVVGSAYIDWYQATLWRRPDTEGDLAVVGLPMLGADIFAQAAGINDVGQVVGSTFENGAFRATLWHAHNDGSFEAVALPALGGVASYANGINDQGQIAGASDTVSGDFHAILWEIEPSSDTPVAQLQQVSGLVDLLVMEGTLNSGQGRALQAKLDAAMASLSQSHTHTAIRQLQAFTNQIRAFMVKGRLSQTDGQNLIDSVNRVIDLLEG